MNSDKHDRAKKCLDRASYITDRLNASVGIKELAIEISQALKFRMSQLRRTPLTDELAASLPSNPKLPPWAREGGTGEVMQLVAIAPSQLQGPQLLENLVAELVGSASQIPMPGTKKKHTVLSFPFIVASLSTQGNPPDLHHDLRLICEAAREEAVDLSAAAVWESCHDTLGEMQRGIQAFAQKDYRNTVFSRHVVALLKGHNTIIANGIAPHKENVRNEAIRILEAEGCPSIGDSTKWRKVYKAAGLKSLPYIRGKRKPS